MDDVLHAIADPWRRELLTRLRSGQSAAGQLGEGLPISQPAVSRHLRVLREAGLVTSEADGRVRHYRLNPESLVPVQDWIHHLITARAEHWVQGLDALDTEIARGRRSRGNATTQEESA